MHNQVLSAIFFIVAAALTIWATKPGSMYEKVPTAFGDDTLRPTAWELREKRFGIEEDRGETIFPVWLAIISAGIFGYSLDLF